MVLSLLVFHFCVWCIRYNETQEIETVLFAFNFYFVELLKAEIYN